MHLAIETIGSGPIVQSKGTSVELPPWCFYSIGNNISNFKNFLFVFFTIQTHQQNQINHATCTLLLALSLTLFWGGKPLYIDFNNILNNQWQILTTYGVSSLIYTKCVQLASSKSGSTPAISSELSNTNLYEGCRKNDMKKNKNKYRTWVLNQ